MKFTLLILSVIILPMGILNTGILSQARQGGLVPVSQGSPASDVGVLSNDLDENQSPTASAALVETTSVPAPNSYVYSSPTDLPTQAVPSALDDFIATLKNGQAGQIVGVYVADVLSLRVAQQPANNPAYVNTDTGYVTQFSLAAQYGSTAFLAHNYLSGALFSHLSAGQEVDVIYGDGSIRRYRILILRRFQALSPLSTASNFVDLDNNSSAQISNSDLFYEIYAKGDRVVFQTCISAHGNTSWGRLFVVATPIL